MKKFLLDIGIIFCLIIFLFSLYCFMNGSLEMYPAEEQEEKVRIASMVFSAAAVLGGIFLGYMRLRLGKKSMVKRIDAEEIEECGKVF